jgi:HD-GYP domain-containing protein (c-di-GMP phosphodiesterase class II)
LCKLSPRDLALLRVASKLHDVGKIGIPDHILLKPGRLEADEREMMKSHAILGQNICEKIPHKDALAISVFVRHHHEAFDGSGYPDGLSGSQIPLFSRIISVADSYDAMLTARPYHHARSHDHIMEIMKSESGRKSDPNLFCHFERLMCGKGRP